MRVLRELRGIVSFMTTIPLGGGDLEEAARGFYLAPLVGALEGLIIGSILALLQAAGATPLALAALYPLLHVSLTGGIHLDGLADYADAVGSRLSGGRALSVMKDPRRGSFASIAVAAIIVSGALGAGEACGSAGHEYQVLAGLACIGAMVWAYTLSSLLMYMVTVSGPVEGYEGLARLFAGKQDARRRAAAPILAITAILPVAVYLYIVGLKAITTAYLAASAPAILAALAVARDARRRIGFITGDVAGAAFEASRTAFIVALAVLIALEL